MTLETNSVNLNTIRLDELDNPGSSLVFGLGNLQVIIVVIELCMWIYLVCNAEGNWQIRLSNSIVPYGFTIGTIFVKGLEQI